MFKQKQKSFNHTNWRLAVTAGLILIAGFIVPKLGWTKSAAVETRSQTVSVTASEIIKRVQADWEFNALAARWTGPQQIDLQVRLKTEGNWTGWLPIQADEDGRAADMNYSNLLFVDPASRFEYKIIGPKPSSIKLDFIYLDTLNEPSWYEQWFGWLTGSARAQDLQVISRSGWGADESLRTDQTGAEIWPLEYSQPKVFIVHHTAGSNGLPDLEQAKAVVRGIYYYHSVTRGWGDIGYNYLVDAAGHIFEGRAGGDGVVGAHTYRDPGCSKGPEAGYNTGSIGIAVLGNYQNVDTVTSEASVALNHLIAVKGRALGIDPAGQTHFVDRDVSKVFGHQDVDCTVCPGADLKNELATIQEAAAAEYQTLPDPAANAVIAGRLVGQSDTAFTLLANESKELWIDVRNEGTTVWRRYIGAPKLVVRSAETSAIRSNGWTDDRIAADLETPNVGPGETGRYHFIITAPPDRASVRAEFELVLNEQPINGTAAAFDLAITGQPLAGQLTEHNLPAAVFAKTNRSVTFAFTNTGRDTWRKGEVKLQIKDANGSASAFISTSSSIGSVAELSDESVAAGQAGHFTITLKSPNQLGQFSNRVSLVREGAELVGSANVLLTRVDSTSQASLVSHTFPTAMLNTWTVPVTVKFTNAGLTTWDRNTVLKITNDDGGPSSFYDPTWPGAAGEIRIQQTRVRPGEIAVYTFKLRAPVQPQTYEQYFQLIDLNHPDVVVQHRVLAPLIRVDAAYPDLNEDEYQAVREAQTWPVATLSKWRPSVTVRYRNVGTAVWDRSTKLYIYGGLFRRSDFRDSSWPNQSGGIQMNETRVEPGQTATFTFRIDPPDEPGIYRVLSRLSIGNHPQQPVPGSLMGELIRVDR